MVRFWGNNFRLFHDFVANLGFHTSAYSPDMALGVLFCKQHLLIHLLVVISGGKEVGDIAMPVAVVPGGVRPAGIIRVTVLLVIAGLSEVR